VAQQGTLATAMATKADKADVTPILPAVQAIQPANAGAVAQEIGARLLKTAP